MAERVAAAVRPTAGELEILRVLWANGPSTVPEVHAALGGSAKKLMVAALSGRRASKRDLAEIRRLIDEMERGAK